MRLASLSPAVTEILFCLGQGKNVVCTDHYSDTPEEVLALPHLKDHQKIDPEALRAHTPELVFTSTVVQEKLAEKLKKDGFAVVHQDPRSIPEIYQSIREIGQLLDCMARAEALIADMQSGFASVKKKVSLFPRRPRVYVEEWHNPPMVSGNWVPEVVRLAGGIPLAVSGERVAGNDGKNPLSREVSLAEIQAFDPDLIVLSICGAGSVASKDLLTSRAGWSDLRAVRENHLFVIDDSLLNRPGPRLTEGASRLFGWVFQVAH
ncbi:MAG: cobalamin-binding protein [Candidatus Peribacteraceae bacterium]